ncbi:ABC transporter substrate-binding protein [Acuticoccus sp. MNP-M23]|uniref:ABC transporter substrate-binding protein n=1 Tax=Acuticoccus sp. MNP-M23 TaxID=3072793 RepID=UPI0028162F09|nr:ABC transporter substrate-binding protein [Acuticoccus sp. MNP-M23]WMS44706.1 ABC transporter substrate-binding protein [Acuticoccus sp. MNP-M23]
MKLNSALLGVVTLCAFALPVTAVAEPASITDITGRTVEVDVPVKSMILGEGRLIYAVAALEEGDPFARVVGWRDDLLKADPATYDVYKAKYPAIDDLPTFGGVKDGTFDVEQAISLDPGIVVMNLEARPATEDAGLDDKLAAVGIPLVYIDFREAPIRNTTQSLEILGTLLGEEDRAADLIAFRDSAIAEVTDVLARAKPAKPLVFIERAAGFSDECCMSFGNENFGTMVELAGGINLAKDIIPGTFGTVNPEQIIASDPDSVIVTGAEWAAYNPVGGWVGLGPNSDMALAHDKLAALMDRPAFTGVKAAETNNVHAVWHQFYNSPYQFVVIQQMAKWLHPDLFPDLDPEATFKELHERFLPVAYDPGYFTSLGED